MPEQAKAITKMVESAAPAAPAQLKLVPPTSLFKRVQQLQEEIAKRAFSLFESNGRPLGRELEDWFKAESELQLLLGSVSEYVARYASSSVQIVRIQGR